MQSRSGSLIETATSTATGYVVAVAAQAIIFPAFGVAVSVSQLAGIAAAFTGVSLVRGYLLRRLFNWLGGRTATNTATK
jgi:hypothetical protein